MDGILPIYKPENITSYDVIRQVKKILPRGTKVGHAGTLDPFAEGVLLILLGKATRRFDEIQSWKKIYRATARLGAKSDTLDREGKIEYSHSDIIYSLRKEEIQKVADRFVGEIEQVVPLYSAAKYKGMALYKYARKDEVVPVKNKKVIVYSIKVGMVTKDEVEMTVECGSGTYIRQLSYDIFHTFDIESYLEKLTRIRVGKIEVNDCVRIEDALGMEELQRRLDGGGFAGSDAPLA